MVICRCNKRGVPLTVYLSIVIRDMSESKRHSRLSIQTRYVTLWFLIYMSLSESLGSILHGVLWIAWFRLVE